MSLDFLFWWLHHRIRSYLGLRVPTSGGPAASPSDQPPDTGSLGDAPDVGAPSFDSQACNGGANGVDAPPGESTSGDDSDRPREDPSRRDLGRRYAATIRGLVEDAYARECPELIVDVLAWSIARIAVNATQPSAITESYRVLSLHMTAMLDERKAKEATGRAAEDEEEEDRVLH